MARLNILKYPDPVLRQLASRVTRFDPDLAALIDDLFETLKVTGGLGLSAPQAGQSRRVLVIHVPGDGLGPQAYVNPELLTRAAPGLVEEGCLSVPGIVGNVVRATQVRVRAQDRDGQLFERDLSGMHAVCLQHEMDHLDGKLFIDRLSWFRRWRIRAATERTARTEQGRQRQRRLGT
jgi:peptide deformylase